MTVAVSSQSPHAQGAPLLSARDQLNVINAYREVGTYRGAAEMCGVDPKTVKRLITSEGVRAQRVREPAITSSSGCWWPPRSTAPSAR